MAGKGIKVTFEVDYGNREIASEFFDEHEELLEGFGEMLAISTIGCKRTFVVGYESEDGWTAPAFAEEALRELEQMGFAVKMARVPYADYLADDSSIINLAIEESR